MSLSFVIQDSNVGPAILRGYEDFVSSAHFDRLTGFYAFASFKGAKLLIDLLEGVVQNWKSIAKRWVISIDGAITEPRALAFLLNQKRTEVRVPYGEKLLQRQFIPEHRFHPKTLLLERKINKTTYEPVGLLVGSANLTFSGLCLGHEHLLFTDLTAAKRGIKPTNELLREIAMLENSVQLANVIDDQFVDRYEALRPRTDRIIVRLEDSRADSLVQPSPVVSPVVSATLVSAENLWVEVRYVVPNRGPNEEGNQIDLKRGTRVFFGFGDNSLPRNSPIGSVRIQYLHHTAMRNLRFGNNLMDKLDLPVPGLEGPPSYSNQTLLFTKTPDGAFRLTVGSQANIALWKSQSRRLGTLFSMQGGREFGVF